MKIKSESIFKICTYLAIVLFLIPQKISALAAPNCVSCGTLIAANSGANITLNTGNNLCIAAGVTYSGNITLNGGTLCNEGTVTNILFNKGTFNNFGQFNRTGPVNINSTGNVEINAFSGSKINVMGAFNFAANSATNNLNVNINQGAFFMVGGSVNASKGNFIIVVGAFDPLSQISETIFNVGGAFNVSNTLLSFTNFGKAYVNINGSLSLDNKLNKTIINEGSFNVNNSINIGGNGQNAGVVIINNSNLFNVTNFFNASYTNGTVTVNNNNSFTIGKSLTLSKNNNNFINNSNLNIGLDFNVERGSATNSGAVTARDFDVKFGTYTNNNVSIASRDFITSNSQAIVNNNGYIEITREFNNTATFNLGQNSLIQTAKYYNLGNGIINGPAVVPDTTLYAKILISGYSENTGYINGGIIVFDQTLVGTNNNNGYGFDQINNSARIANTIIFGTRSAGPVNPVIINCVALQEIFGIGPKQIPAPIICGGGVPVLLKAQLYAFTPNGFIPFNSPLVAYSWQAPLQNGQNITVMPTSTQTYTMYAMYGGCIYSNTVTVVVTSPANFIATITGTPDILYPYPDALNLNSSVVGGSTPYSFAWTPNVYFLSPGNLVQNPNVNPPVALNYTLTVTDANGCKTTATVNVIPSPYAPLNKTPDGGYYKLVNNRLQFKFDGQYATTGLVYNVYDKTNTLVNVPVSSLIIISGDNRYSLNATTLTASDYYTLEIINEKKEKMYLRFVR